MRRAGRQLMLKPKEEDTGRRSRSQSVGPRSHSLRSRSETRDRQPQPTTSAPSTTKKAKAGQPTEAWLMSQANLQVFERSLTTPRAKPVRISTYFDSGKIHRVELRSFVRAAKKKQPCSCGASTNRPSSKSAEVVHVPDHEDEEDVN